MSAEDATEVLAQFEPDPDGIGSIEPEVEATESGGPDDAPWVVWLDAAGEAAWAAAELLQIGAAWR